MVETLFTPKENAPLADRMRPTCLRNIVGQEHLLGPSGILTKMKNANHMHSLILWGPPGSGKTTIARLLANTCGLHFQPLSAVLSGVTELKQHFNNAHTRQQNGIKTLLFIDEIHRFNRSQQDCLLPNVENGTVTLIGATTENPSFALNNALLSRCQTLPLFPLEKKALETLLLRAEHIFQKTFPLTEQARETLLNMADGDGRYLLNMVEIIAHEPNEKHITPEQLVSLVQKRAPLYDKGQDNHYNLISALHKSLRASDVNAALYWFARMVEGGEDMNYIARRLVRFASEDIGMADPQAMPQTIAAWQSFERLGSPEGNLSIIQAIVYLATAPKSNSLYLAEKNAKKIAQENGALMPPKNILNAPTKLMKSMEYGKNYIYEHNTDTAYSGQNCLPETLSKISLYTPKERGFEREITKRLHYWKSLKNRSINQ